MLASIVRCGEARSQRGPCACRYGSVVGPPDSLSRKDQYRIRDKSLPSDLVFKCAQSRSVKGFPSRSQVISQLAAARLSDTNLMLLSVTFPGRNKAAEFSFSKVSTSSRTPWFWTYVQYQLIQRLPSSRWVHAGSGKIGGRRRGKLARAACLTSRWKRLTLQAPVTLNNQNRWLTEWLTLTEAELGERGLGRLGRNPSDEPVTSCALLYLTWYWQR